jgi:hypothetical protein
MCMPKGLAQSRYGTMIVYRCSRQCTSNKCIVCGKGNLNFIHVYKYRARRATKPRTVLSMTSCSRSSSVMVPSNRCRAWHCVRRKPHANTCRGLPQARYTTSLCASTRYAVTIPCAHFDDGRLRRVVACHPKPCTCVTFAAPARRIHPHLCNTTTT